MHRQSEAIVLGDSCPEISAMALVSFLCFPVLLLYSIYNVINRMVSTLGQPSIALVAAKAIIRKSGALSPPAGPKAAPLPRSTHVVSSSLTFISLPFPTLPFLSLLLLHRLWPNRLLSSTATTRSTSAKW